MSTAKHTEGPWRKWRLAPDSDPQERTIIVDKTGDVEICGIVGNEADADLISAAPDMLEACRGALRLRAMEFQLRTGLYLTPHERQAMAFCAARIEAQLRTAIAKADAASNEYRYVFDRDSCKAIYGPVPEQEALDWLTVEGNEKRPGTPLYGLVSRDYLARNGFYPDTAVGDRTLLDDLAQAGFK